MNYYNEFDPFAAYWLENLIAAELIPAGIVDRRSIKEVQPNDLQGYEQAHFFAGIGGWSEALRLAGWTGPCWTGSCPCQPFSSAGKRKGTDDERHLWPEFFRLIKACRPPVVIGEQVGGKLGYQWLAGVYADLEATGYRVPTDEDGNYEAYDLPAASIGAPHIRQRIYWVADTGPNIGRPGSGQWDGLEATERCESRIDTEYRSRERDGMANTKRAGVRLPGYRADSTAASGVQGTHGQREWLRTDAGAMRDAEHGRLADTSGERLREAGHSRGVGADGQQRVGTTDRLGNTSSTRLQERISIGRTESSEAGTGTRQAVELASCRDGKARRFESGSFPLAHAIPRRLGQGKSELASLARPASRNRVGRLRGYGNAIVPTVAAEFIKAFRDSRAPA